MSTTGSRAETIQLTPARFGRLTLAHLAFTLAMVGLMTTVQLVVYPQYDQVAPDDFSTYVSQHGLRIGLPLVLFAIAEVALALLLWRRSPPGRLKVVAFGSGALLALAWIATVVWFGPLHGRLVSEPYDPGRIDLLANTNWLRTIIWWIRGAIAFWFAAAVFDRFSTSRTDG